MDQEKLLKAESSPVTITSFMVGKVSPNRNRVTKDS